MGFGKQGQSLFMEEAFPDGREARVLNRLEDMR